MKKTTKFPKSQIYGVDFSGAIQACNKIWISIGTISNNKLQINDCIQIKEMVKGRFDRDQCLLALKNFIEIKSNAAFGIDFPFGLPRSLLTVDNWEVFIRQFSHQYDSPEQFQQNCTQTSQEKNQVKELKRITDIESQSPFCVYNRWIYKQTYYGIRNILHPIVRDNTACILPFQQPELGKPWVFEICPASTLKNEGLYYSYKEKNNNGEKMQNRILILESLIEKCLIKNVSSKVREKILNDSKGDALDSVVASIATFRALKNYNQKLNENDYYYLEGYIYI